MRLTILLGLVLLSTSLFSQIRVVFSNDVYVVLDNGVNLVLDNPANTALSIANGRIISEDESNIVKWNMGSTVGNYRIPFYSTNGTPTNTADDDPLTIYLNLNTAGSSDGSVVFSTYNTASNNTPLPSGVTDLDMDGIPGDESLLLVDRFYILDASSYTSKPNVLFHLTWDDDEWAAPNTINETTIRTQRWNSNTNQWDDQSAFGNNDSGTNRVINIVPSAGTFFRTWVLVGQDVPLPIELVEFGSTCDDQRTKIFWTTVSETNNDYFSLFKSKDGFSWDLLQQVAGAGNSVNELAYEVWDDRPLAGNSFYKLAQTDYNGDEKTYGPINNVCGDFLFEIVAVIPNFNSQSGQLDVVVSAGSYEIFNLKLLDLSGKEILSIPHQELYTGMNTLRLDKGNIAMGAYILELRSEKHLLTSKVILN